MTIFVGTNCSWKISLCHIKGDYILIITISMTFEKIPTVVPGTSIEKKFKIFFYFNKVECAHFSQV
jgi:hypothetical protein